MEEREMRKRKPKYVEILERMHRITGHEAYRTLLDAHEALSAVPGLREEMREEVKRMFEAIAKQGSLLETENKDLHDALREVRSIVDELKETSPDTLEEIQARMRLSEELLEKMKRIQRILENLRALKVQREMLKKGQPVM